MFSVSWLAPPREASAAAHRTRLLAAPARQRVSPHGHPALETGDLHVWRADLRSRSDDLEGCLSGQERVRLEAFADPSRGAMWGRSRAALRRLLGRYLDTDPRGLEFQLGSHGKPIVEGGPAFNLSHSAHLALLAFQVDGEVGVDVEVDRRELDELSLSARALGAQTTGRLAALAPASRRTEFLRAWTIHEAALKLNGTGIGGETDTPDRSAPWLAQLEVGPGAAGAVAADSKPARLSLWELSGTY